MIEEYFAVGAARMCGGNTTTWRLVGGLAPSFSGSGGANEKRNKKTVSTSLNHRGVAPQPSLLPSIDTPSSARQAGQSALLSDAKLERAVLENSFAGRLGLLVRANSVLSSGTLLEPHCGIAIYITSQAG
jgi:hypothetical protein